MLLTRLTSTGKSDISKPTGSVESTPSTPAPFAAIGASMFIPAEPPLLIIARISPEGLYPPDESDAIEDMLPDSDRTPCADADAAAGTGAAPLTATLGPIELRLMCCIDGAGAVDPLPEGPNAERPIAACD